MTTKQEIERSVLFEVWIEIEHLIGKTKGKKKYSAYVDGLKKAQNAVMMHMPDSEEKADV